MVNDLNVEELLIQTNPVLNPEELRLSADEVDARCASILERRGVMQTQTPSRAPTDARAPRRWRKPAFAFMVGLLVILIAAGGVALLIGGGDPDVIEEPAVTTAPTTPSTTATTTPAVVVPETVLDGRITAPVYAEVPSFTGTVEYYEHDPALSDPGWHATVVVSHSGPLKYEAKVLSEVGEFLALMGPGTAFLGDGIENWMTEAGSSAPVPINDFQPIRHLFFDGEHWMPIWDEICGATPTELGVETIAGRSTTHVECSTATEDYELWVDESTGVVMKMAGPLGMGDLSPLAARDGGFVFTAFALDSVVIPEPLEFPKAELGVYPPFHMVRSTTYEGGSDTDEIWFLDENTVRETVTDSSIVERVGTFELTADGFASSCFPGEGVCERRDVTHDAGHQPIIWQIPVALVEEHCTEAGEDTVAGRPARHFVCEGVSFVAMERELGRYWSVESGSGTPQHWFDTATGLHVKALHNWTVEATLLEIDPVFPDGIFEYEPMEFGPGADALEPGEMAPLWRGPLIGGGEFDLANYAGSGGDTVVVFNWFPTCGDSCLEGLDLMQRLHDEYDPATGSDIVFVTVSEDIESETARLVQRRGNTVPAVYCVAVLEPPYQDPVCATSVPGVDPWEASPWFLWGNPIPSTTVIDSTGVVIGVFTGYPSEYEADLEALLGQIAGVSP